jgi:serine/threonine-protein kinase
MFFNRDHVSRGDEHYRKGSLNKAAEHYLKAKRYRQAAAIYEELGEYDKAADIYDSRGHSLEAAQLLAGQGELKRAVALFEKAGDFRQAAEASLKLRSYVRAGHLFEKAEMFDRAAECFTKAKEPELIVGALEKEAAHLRARRGHSEPGVDKKIRDNVYRRAEALAVLGRHLEAAELLAEHGADERAAPLFARAGQPAVAAQAYLAAGRFEDALRAIEGAGESEDELRAEIYLNCARHADAARLFERIGRFDAAASAYEGDEAWSEAAALWEKAGSPGRAAELYLQLHRHADAGRCLAADGQTERAADAFQKSSMHHEAADAYRDAGRFLWAGNGYLEAGDAQAARQAYEAVGEDQPEYGRACLQLIPLLADDGSLDEARRRWQVMEEQNVPVPSHERLYVEARLCEAGGRYQEAETLYQKVLADRFGFRDAAERLRDVRGKVSLPPGALDGASDGNDTPGNDTRGEREPVAEPAPESRPGRTSGSFSALPSLLDTSDLPFEIHGEIEAWWKGAAFFRALDRRSDQEVFLVSFPLAEVGGREEGFRHGMKEVAAVYHPAILQLREAILASDKVLLLYETFSGETLGRRSREHKWPPAAAASLIVQLCEALAAAHKLGVTHQWISPRTVLADDDGRVKLVGLGLREILADRDDVSRAYLSPEVRGDGILGPASDVFSLGLLALELLQAELPDAGADGERIATDAVGWPPEVKKAFPAAVRELLVRTVSPEPSARPSTEELRAALTALGLVPGQVLADRYQILGALGSGGMSRVYRARDRDLGEEVAIKTLLSSTVGTEDEERLLREVRICRRISHPNVVRVHDIGRFTGGYFVTMELLDGSGLDQLIEEEAPLDLQRTKKLLTEIVGALAEAHRLKIVHRDLKPSNVMLCDGRVKVVDFGIARVADGSTGHLTQTGVTLGSPMYMAPEQIQGKPLTGACDIYSLGVIAYTLLAGREPFTGETTTAVALKQLYEPPPDLRELRPELPLPWIELIESMLAKSPDDRPASARELAGRLAEMPDADTE